MALSAAGKYRERFGLRVAPTPAGLGHVPRVKYNDSFLDAGQILRCCEGVDILPVKPKQLANYGPHQYLCSTTGSRPVKIRHSSICRVLHASGRFARAAVALVLLVTAGTAFAQQATTIESIRVIGNRRIPKETILARMFSHNGDTYDTLSVERDFNSLWNTGYFEDLRIEREE